MIQPPNHISKLGAVAAISCAALLAGCSEQGSSEITATREISKFEGAVPVDMTPEERFRFSEMMAPANAAPAAAQDSAAAAPAGGAAVLKWDTPEGWSDAGASSMRDVNLSFGPNGEGECYVARLPGAAGGLESNVNRWRKQMGQGDLSQAEIQALAEREIFGAPASFVSIDGSFTGMGGKATIDDARMLGLILMTPNGALFVKMTGPRELVEANTEKFEAFCSSLRLE